MATAISGQNPLNAQQALALNYIHDVLFADKKNKSRKDMLLSLTYILSKLVKHFEAQGQYLSKYSLRNILHVLVRNNYLYSPHFNSYRRNAETYIIDVLPNETQAETNSRYLELETKQAEAKKAREKVSEILYADKDIRETALKIDTQQQHLDSLRSQLTNANHALYNCQQQNRVKLGAKVIETKRNDYSETLRGVRSIIEMLDGGTKYQKFRWDAAEIPQQKEAKEIFNQKLERTQTILKKIEAQIEQINQEAKNEVAFPEYKTLKAVVDKIASEISVAEKNLNELKRQYTNLRQKLRRPVKNTVNNPLVMNL